MAIINSAKYGINGYGDQAEHKERGAPGTILWFFQLDMDGDGILDSHTLPTSIRSVEFNRGVKQRHDPRAFGPSQPERENFTIEILDSAGGWWNSVEKSGLADLTTGRKARLNAISTTTRGPMKAVFTGVLRAVSYDPNLGRVLFKGNGMADTLMLGAAADVRDKAIPYNTPAAEPFLPGNGAPVPIRHWRGESKGTGPKAMAEIVLEACGKPVSVAMTDREEETPEYFTLTGGSAWNALRWICAMYMARVEFNALGAMRLRRLTEETEDIALSAADLTAGRAKEIIPAPGVINHVNAWVKPLYCPPLSTPIPFAAYQLAWRAAGPIEVAPGETKILDIRFKKTLGSVFAANFTRVNSDSIVDPDPFSVNSAADKSGVDMGASNGNGEASFYIRSESLLDPDVPYTLFQNYGGKQDQCRVILSNVSETRTAYFFNLRLYAAGLSQRQEDSAFELIDSECVSAFGERVARVSNPLLQTRELAERCAADALTYFRSPDRANVVTASLITRGDPAMEVFERFELGKVIHIPAGSSLPTGEYRVLGSKTQWLSPTGQISRHEIWMEKLLAPRVKVDRVSGQVVSNAPGISWTHSGGTRAGEYILVAVCRRSWDDVSTVSLDGVPMTRLERAALGNQQNGDAPSVEIWGAAGVAGMGQIDITFGATDWAEGVCLSVISANQEAPIRWIETTLSAGSAAGVTCRISESDLLICAAGFQQFAPPILERGEQITQLTSDGNWRCSVASATGLREAACAWSAITGGAVMIGVVLSAKWHHETN